jgi:guanosine-3',5'-bis(diphosphate) 3'-pyrophosphohydrolase
MSDPRKSEELQLVFRAATFAAHKHKRQTRKGDGAPYIQHPLAVADVLAQAGITDAETLAAALLHDTVEDTETTPEELEAAFGPRVRRIVMDVTDDKALPKAERKRLQVAHAPHLAQDSKLVKLADKIANIRDLVHAPSPWNVEVTQGYVLWGREVCRGLRGTNAKLDAWADELWAASFVGADGVSHPTIPPGDPEALLARYYALISV